MKKRTAGTIFAKGMAIGLADLIPGVSGGTVALITGIYEKLVWEIRNIRPRTILNTARRMGPDSERIDVGFLAPLGAGVALTFLGLSYALTFMLDEMASATYAFFFTVILGSSLVLFKSERLFSAKHLATAAIGFFIAYLVMGLEPSTLGHSLPLLFFTGMLVIIAMILPGISGALLLLIMNQYEFFFDSLHAFNMPVLFAFGSGAVVGILGFSRILSRLLRSHRAGTISLLIGFTLGSLRVCYEKVELDSGTAFPVFFALFLGFFVMFMLEAPNILPARKHSRL